MPSAKETVVKIVEKQPDDSSYDEIVRELASPAWSSADWRIPTTAELSRPRRSSGESSLGASSMDRRSGTPAPRHL